MSAIPNTWEKMVEKDKNSVNYFRMHRCQIWVENTSKRLEEIQSKELNQIFIAQITERPTSEAKWEEKVGLQFNEEMWGRIYLNPYRLIKEASILTLHFKITHRTLACGYNLNIWKINENNLCEVCKQEIDSIEHYLVACNPTLKFWNTVFNWWKTSMGFLFPVDTYDILFGLNNEQDDNQINQLNYTLLMGCNFVYRTKKANKEANLYEFLIYCKNNLEIKRESYCMKNLESKFNKSWETLYCAI
jgi:hypothetical protein